MVTSQWVLRRISVRAKGFCETMTIKEWIKGTGEKIREAIEQALPPPPRPERVPIRIPIPVDTPRPTRHYY